jgi:hypothetical protein
MLCRLNSAGSDPAEKYSAITYFKQLFAAQEPCSFPVQVVARFSLQFIVVFVRYFLFFDSTKLRQNTTLKRFLCAYTA